MRVKVVLLVAVATLAAAAAAGAIVLTRPSVAPLPAASTQLAHHFDNGTFAFDYPADWRDLSDGSGPIVLGTGTWCSGLPDSGCTSETLGVADGAVVLEVWQNEESAPGYCSSPTPPGPAASRYPEDLAEPSLPTTHWEIRQPGYGFGSGGNAWVEAVSANPAELARAQSLVDTFRWDADYCASPSAGPSIPGTPGRLDNGTFTFTYPAEWHGISGSYYEGMPIRVGIVLGNGDWHSGCRYNERGGGCSGDTVDVSGGRAVVKIWQRLDGPPDDCQASATANATFGTNLVFETGDGISTTWEIRQPGARFSWMGNVEVQAWTGGAEARAQVEELLASFQWNPRLHIENTCIPSLARYDADGISFDYPADWRVGSGHERLSADGRTVMFAVGTGIFYGGCFDLLMGAGMECGDPSVDVTADQVVVFMYEGAHSGEPSPVSVVSAPPGQTATTVAGRPAHGASGYHWIRWWLTDVTYIAAYWGSDAPDAMPDVRALVDSLAISG
jgi:hypothetical protein